MVSVLLCETSFDRNCSFCDNSLLFIFTVYYLLLIFIIIFFLRIKLHLYVFNSISRAEDDGRVSFLSLYKKSSSFMFSTTFFELKTMVVSVLFLFIKKSFSFMFSTTFFELKTMAVSVFFFPLRKRLQLYVINSIFRAVDNGLVSFLVPFIFIFNFNKLQLYVFYDIFRAEDDGRVSFLFLFTKYAQALYFLRHFSS